MFECAEKTKTYFSCYTRKYIENKLYGMSRNCIRCLIIEILWEILENSRAFFWWFSLSKLNKLSGKLFLSIYLRYFVDFGSWGGFNTFRNAALNCNIFTYQTYVGVRVGKIPQIWNPQQNIEKLLSQNLTLKIQASNSSNYLPNWRLNFWWWVLGTIIFQIFADGLKSVEFAPP